MWAGAFVIPRGVCLAGVPSGKYFANCLLGVPLTMIGEISYAWGPPSVAVMISFGLLRLGFGVVWLAFGLATWAAVSAAGAAIVSMREVCLADVFGAVSCSCLCLFGAGGGAAVPPVARERSWGLGLRGADVVVGGGGLNPSSNLKVMEGLVLEPDTPRASIVIPVIPCAQACMAAGSFTVASISFW